MVVISHYFSVGGLMSFEWALEWGRGLFHNIVCYDDSYQIFKQINVILNNSFPLLKFIHCEHKFKRKFLNPELIFFYSKIIYDNF